jgi:hypothetical protein
MLRQQLIILNRHVKRPGDVISPSDLVEVSIYQDANVSRYIPAGEINGVMGGVSALPVSAG